MAERRTAIATELSVQRVIQRPRTETWPAPRPGVAVLLVASVLAIGPASVVAQTIMQEVIVTAQKREQSLDEVPGAVSALSGDALRELGFQSATDIAAQIPNVDLRDQGATLVFSIRGNTLNDFGDANEPPVGFYIDDVYRGTLAGQGNQLFDMERVEVLRGPQGTLYGRNTTAGLIHYISKKPTEELDGYLQVQLGSFDQRIVEAAVGGPLGSRVRGRVAAKYNEDNGWQENAAAGGGRFAVTDVGAARGQLEIDVTDNLTALTAVSYSKQNNTSPIYGYMGVLTSPESLEQCATPDIDAGRCFNLAGFREPDPDPERVYTELTPDEAVSDAEIFSASERLTWSLADDLELVSITAYESVERLAVLDEDSSATGAFGDGTQFRDSYGADTHQFSQELRLSGRLADAPWIAGLFFYDDNKDVTSTIRDFESVPGTPDTMATLDTRSWAVYADWQPKLSDAIGMVVGLRYTDEEKSVDAITQGIPVPRKSISDSAVTGRLGITWSPGDDLLTYATVSTGYKSGEFNTTLLLGDTEAVTSADQETATSLEVGAKWGFWDNKARIRAAAFYTETKDKQGVLIDGGGSPQTRLVNFGDVDAYGGELELLLNPVDALEVSLALGLLDTEIDSNPASRLRAGFGTGADAFIGDVFFIDGTDATTSPGWTVSGIVRYGFDLSSAGELTLQTDFDWQGDDSGDVGNTGFALQKSYALFNFRALWKSPADRYYGEVFVENAFNEEYHQGGYILAGFDYQSVTWGRPRWVGARVGTRF